MTQQCQVSIQPSATGYQALMAEAVEAAEAAASVSSASILKVWDIVNRHFESLLVTAARSATKSRAEIDIQSQTKELRDVMAVCSRRMQNVETYISELQKQETGANNNNKRESVHAPYSDLAGDWHFLYIDENAVFGYMKLVPETVSVVDCGGKGSTVKRAEFTLPPGLLRDANEVSDEDVGGDDDEHLVTQLNRNYALCPCCRISFKMSEYWKHALFEIAEKGNRVPAWQSLDLSNATRWIVEESTGWKDPIYRPRGLESTCEIGQSLAELNLKHFLSDYEFSSTLDRTFEFLAVNLGK